MDLEPHPVELDWDNGLPDWQGSSFRLLTAAVFIEAQRIESERPFAIVQPPQDEELECMRDNVSQLALYDELPAQFTLLKNWVQSIRPNLLAIANDNIGLERSKNERDANQHVLDGLKSEILDAFFTLGHRKFSVNGQTSMEVTVQNSFIQLTSNSANVEETVAPETPAGSLSRVPTLSSQSSRLSSIRGEIKSLMSAQMSSRADIHKLSEDVETLAKGLGDHDITPGLDMNVSCAIGRVNLYRHVVRDLVVEMFYEGRSWLFTTMRDDNGHMKMDIHKLSGMPWRLLELWMKKERLTPELMGQYVQGLL